MNGFPSRRRTIIWIENPEQYKQSRDAILQKAPAVPFPGHGEPFKTPDLRKYRSSLERIKLYPLKERNGELPKGRRSFFDRSEKE